MTVRRTYTDTQRAEALRLYTEVGPAEAARRTGVVAATLRKWAERAGVTGGSPNQPTEAFEAAKVAWETRKKTLADDFGQVAAELLQHVRKAAGEQGRSRDAQALMTAAAIGVDKAQLLAGGATSRIEMPDGQDRAARLAAVHQLKDQAGRRQGEEQTA